MHNHLVTQATGLPRQLKHPIQPPYDMLVQYRVWGPPREKQPNSKKREKRREREREREQVRRVTVCNHVT